VRVTWWLWGWPGPSWWSKLFVAERGSKPPQVAQQCRAGCPVGGDSFYLSWPHAWQLGLPRVTCTMSFRVPRRCGVGRGFRAGVWGFLDIVTLGDTQGSSGTQTAKPRTPPCVAGEAGVQLRPRHPPGTPETQGSTQPQPPQSSLLGRGGGTGLTYGGGDTEACWGSLRHFSRWPSLDSRTSLGGQGARGGHFKRAWATSVLWLRPPRDTGDILVHGELGD
jgi:hypothetical protein